MMMSLPFRELSEFKESSIIGKINDAGPDIVWVDLSAQKQEHWVASRV